MYVDIVLLYVTEPHQKDDYYLTLVPQGMLTIVSWLEARGISAALVNGSGMSPGEIVTKVLSYSPLAVSLSMMTHNRVSTLAVGELIKKGAPGVVLALGGVHATFLSDELLTRNRWLDSVIIGEGELSTERLVLDIKGKKGTEPTYTSRRIENLDNIPWPSMFTGSMEGININEQYKYLITSRGCPYSCTYCSSPAFWKRKVTWRSAENIVEEIRHLYYHYGIIYFAIRDDNFVLDKKRVMEFCSLMDREPFGVMWSCQGRLESVDEEMLLAMKKAGLEHIQYGFESGSEAILKKYSKKLSLEAALSASRITHRCGIPLSAYYMTGMEGEQERDIALSRELIEKTQPGDLVVSPVALFPGTALYNEEKKKGQLDSIWFTSEEEGIYLRNDRESARWPGMLQEFFMNHARGVQRHFIARNLKDDWVGHLLAGDSYRYKENYRKAGEHYNKASNMVPRSVWPLLKQGKNECMAGEFMKAHNFLDQFIEMLPTSYLGHYYHALCYEMEGDIIRARFHGEKAGVLNPLDREIKYLEKRLKRM